MNSRDNRRYWPFDSSVILNSEELEFFKGITKKGFEAFQFDINNCGASSDIREGWIIVRGRKRWEIRLAEGDDWQLSAFIADFGAASRAISKWLDGEDPGTIIESIHDVLVIPPGAQGSYTFHDEKEWLSI